MQNIESTLERDNTTGRNHEGPTANTPVRVLTATSIIGDEVENLKGDTLGSIKDIMINLLDGSIEYVILQSGGFLGIGDKLFAIPFQALRLDAERELFILDKDENYIKNAPGFDQDHWPETNDHYNSINNYWGVERNSAYSDQNSNVGSSGILNPTNSGNVGPLI
ncbi:MAG TPA: PRC-barrel domain-containing protein [Cytophagales bacterium]|nr:PRC-barrel domain-containing protein [Cytophagales bacterium]